MSTVNQPPEKLRSESGTEEIIQIDAALSLHTADEKYAEPLFHVIHANRAYLQRSMNWPQQVISADDTRKTLIANRVLHQRDYSKMYIIVRDNAVIGVFSFNLIEPTNKTAYIGYWLAENQQGLGIIASIMTRIVDLYTQSGMIRRFVIKCIVNNARSNRVAQRAGFQLEGRLKGAEYLNGTYYDQYIYGRVADPSSMPD